MAAYDPCLYPVDSVIMADLESPGIARLEGFASRRKVDVRGAYGISATVAVWLEVAEGKIIIELWSAADWEAWDRWSKATVLREIKKGRQAAGDYALDVWHPWLEMLDIKSLIVKSVSQPVEIHPTVWAITIDCIEYRQAKLTLSKPEASKQKPGDAVDEEIDRLSRRIRDLNQELAK